ncbi:MAG: hypothetical protein ACTSRG_09170 [Candidatus Helarchaeota archaeon]
MLENVKRFGFLGFFVLITGIFSVFVTIYFFFTYLQTGDTQNLTAGLLSLSVSFFFLGITTYAILFIRKIPERQAKREENLRKAILYNSEYVSKLNMLTDKNQGPFTIEQASDALNLSNEETKTLLMNDPFNLIFSKDAIYFYKTYTKETYEKIKLELAKY